MSNNVTGSTDGGELVVVVTVVDETNRTLSGRDNLAYTSPPQSREDALTLVELLLGHPPSVETGWWRPIAGGRRTITLQHAVDGVDARP